MSDLPTSPMVDEALRVGRAPNDIMAVVCDDCRKMSYYNQGSHATCEHCERILDHLLDDDEDIGALEDAWDAALDPDLQ
jgi:hypothetical protein